VNSTTRVAHFDVNLSPISKDIRRLRWRNASGGDRMILELANLTPDIASKASML
jgi:hypothetical protein